MGRDLRAFDAANDRKLSWPERVQLIERQFPSTRHLNGKGLFDDDVETFGRLLRDILKADLSTPGKPGPRPPLDHEAAVARLRQFMGNDYSLYSFTEAFSTLTGGESYRAVAKRTGLNRNTVYRLQRGELHPDAYMLETIAESYSKHPSYFMEWRIGYVMSALMDRLSDPETSIATYERIKRTNAQRH